MLATANRVCSRERTTLRKMRWTITWRKKYIFPETVTVKRLAEELRGAGGGFK